MRVKQGLRVGWGGGHLSSREKNELYFRTPKKKKKKFIYKILTSLTRHGTSRGIYFKSICYLSFKKINLLTSYMTYRYIYFFLTDRHLP